VAIVRPITEPELWDEWVASRPPVIQELCRQYPPDRLYRMDGDGHRVTIHGYSEDGTLIVEIRGAYNRLVFERNVFGVDPLRLTECDPPGPDEPCGAVLTEDDAIEAYIDKFRPAAKAWLN
jgi:hypothetical protein